MTASSLRLDNVHVRFPIIGTDGRSLKKSMLSSIIGVAGRNKIGGNVLADAKTTVVHALNDVSIDLRHGARIGLIGHNGAGKTTLLRTIAGIYPPTSGSMHVHGRITSLLDIALGVDPNVSGQENILLRSLYMGRSRREALDAIDDVADFTELGSFLDMPVRTYSAGMQTRLLFAIATAFRADILLMDEGLGAGDAAFAERAEMRMDQFTRQAGILVLASHDQGLLKRFCDTLIEMESGRIVRSGSVDSMLEKAG